MTPAVHISTEKRSFGALRAGKKKRHIEKDRREEFLYLDSLQVFLDAGSKPLSLCNDEKSCTDVFRFSGSSQAGIPFVIVPAAYWYDESNRK